MKNELYIERSKVREILIGHNAATQAVLSKIDSLQIFTAEDFGAPAHQPPMLADIAQIIDSGWKSGKPAAEVAGEILREFDGTSVTSIDGGAK